MLPSLPQELEASCIAACVRMVLAALGHIFTESEIRERCGYTKIGMRLNQVAKGLNDLPVKVDYHIDDWSIDDLKEAIRKSAFPIAGIDLRPVEGVFAFHAVVIANITSDQVITHDPRYSYNTQALSLNLFDAAWNGADHEALIITL